MKFMVHLDVHSYDVILKRGCLQNAYQFIHMGRKAAILTDTGVPVQYAQQIADQCREYRIITIKQGENGKSLAVLEDVLQQMLDFGMSKQDLVVAVGGGMVGNLAGVAASLYLQGIDFVNCPTTTLAMANRAIGGTVSVNLGRSRNVIGATYRPKLVLVDPDTLTTLPRRHYINGFAEALKQALCFDPVLFDLLESGDVDTDIESILLRCLTIRKGLAEQERSQPGICCALQFGHTLGDAIEAVKGNWGRRTTGLYHGECVALGMLPMIENKALQKRTRAIMRRLGLPTRCVYDKEAVLAAMLRLHAPQQGQFTVIRVPGLGCWRADAVHENDLRNIVYNK